MSGASEGSAGQKLFRELSRLSAAEEFFEYLAVPYDKHVVNVNRLHILSRFRQYLAGALDDAPAEGEQLRALCASLLERAHEDFVCSTAQAEKVFRVFQNQTAEVAVKAIARAPAAPPKGE